MGYSISIRTRSPMFRTRMLAFMAKHFRPWSQLVGKGEVQDNYSSIPTDDLSYDQSALKTKIGFDYNSGLGDGEREYVYAVLRWMAIRVGTRRQKFSKEAVTPNIMKEPMPFTLYDGFEAWPVIVVKTHTEAKRIPASLQWCVHDRLGMKAGPQRWKRLLKSMSPFGLDDKALEAMRKDIKALGKCEYTDEKLTKAWYAKFDAIQLLYLQPIMEEHFGLIRTEMERIDALWVKASV